MVEAHDEKLHQRLKERAKEFCAELGRHPVLSRYWEELSVVLKGSTAHGYSDRYSDVDLVLFCPENIKREIVRDYVNQGLSQREDGVFLPLHDWEGHYNLESYEELREHLEKIEYIWEYAGSQALHDPKGGFASLVEEGLSAFRRRCGELIKGSYLQCQLQLDWLRQPLRRADAGAALLYGSNLYREVCRTLFLLRGQAYPCDKWLPHYLRSLELPKSMAELVEGYPRLFSLEGLRPGLELMEYPLYRKGAEMLEESKPLLRERCGDQPWIEEWYLYA